MARGMLIDLVRCIGCRACQAACKAWNDLPAEKTSNRGSYENPPRRSAKTWTTITFHEVEHEGALHWVFAKRQCMHCEEPGCAAACPVGALQKTPDGPVVYDDRRCIGCRYCMLACPFGVPTFQWDEPVPYIRKCTMCEERLAGGGEPACAKACPSGALRFGSRSDLLATAHARLNRRPAAYVDHVYGEREAGGTAKLYLSPVPFEKLGFPRLGPEPAARYTEPAMRAVPFAAGAVAAALGGACWFARRRERVDRAEQIDRAEPGERAEQIDRAEPGENGEQS